LINPPTILPKKSICVYRQINNNKLGGPFPTEILQMPSLNYLDLSQNKFYGSINFSGTPWLSSLYTLNISYNDFNDTFFSGSDLDPQTLDLSNNHFKNVTFDIYNGTDTHTGNDYMPSLQKLYIQNNNLSGTFPVQILKAPSLQFLFADGNQYETLQLPDMKSFENFTLSMVFLTNNKFEDIQYANMGPFATYYLQVSSLLL
jgi:Leucine-rich repeat (LRR) protein